MALPGIEIPDFSTRLEIEEWMDDLSREDDQIGRALHDLRRINRFLGGHRATTSVLDPLLKRRDRLRLLDVGCGGADMLAQIVLRGQRLGCAVEATGIDANPAIVEFARSYLDHRLSAPLRKHTTISTANALDLPYGADRFDVSHAALFLHHFHGPELVRLLEEMNRVSTQGLVVNDLHRHPLAYAGIWTVSRVCGLSKMVQHDGPLSVRRGFRYTDLHQLAHTVNASEPTIRWHWAFRWTLSTISDASDPVGKQA